MSTRPPNAGQEVEEVRAECRRLRTVMGTVGAKEITYHAIPVEPGDIIFLVSNILFSEKLWKSTSTLSS